jgi:glycosyltransferase involved in cell wall biosynthesis
VTVEAPDPRFSPVRQEERLQTVRSQYGLGPDFVLAVGNLQPRKNLLRLIKAFASVREQMEGIQLVVVGKAQWQASAVYETVKHMGLEGDVLFLGYVPDGDLMLLYNCARVFVYPSIYEGFGLPVVEAMACGTPVVTSNTSSLPEVAADAAILVDPHSEEQIADALRRVLLDPDLALSLSRKGLRRAKQFSWQQTAQDTVAVYQTVLGRVAYQEALR